MTTYGNIITNELISIILNEDGSLKYFSSGELIPDEQEQNLVPLIKIPMPDYDSEIEECKPVLNWFADRVERDWEIVPISPSKSRANMRSALRQQWDTLPDYIRGPYRPEFEAANKLLDEGDDAGAIAMIQYAPARPDFTQEQITIFNIVKQQMISGINHLPNLY